MILAAENCWRGMVDSGLVCRDHYVGLAGGGSGSGRSSSGDRRAGSLKTRAFQDNSASCA